MNLSSPRLQFTRDARHVVAALADRVAIHRAGAAAGATARETAIVELACVTSLAAFADQLWTTTSATLQRWDLTGHSIGTSIELTDAPATTLVPALAGPAVAALCAQLWFGERASLSAIELGSDTLPFLGRKTIELVRHRGARLVRLGTACWRLPSNTHLLAAAPLFDGAGVVLFVRRGEQVEAWSSTAAGEIRHVVALPDGELRLASRRGLALVRTRPDSFIAFDLRYGRMLGHGAIAGDDFAIDPDGRYLAAMCDGELYLTTLEDALRAATMKDPTMSDYDEAVEATEHQRDVAEKVMDAGSVPGAPIMAGINNGITVGKGIDEIEKGDTGKGVTDVGIGGTGVVAAGAELLKQGAEAAGSEGLAGTAGTVGSVVGVVSGGLTAGKGVGEIATSDGWNSQRMDGIHDVLTGGAGAIGSLPGGAENPLALGGKVFGAGMAVGDMIAPTIFGDMKEKGSHMEEVPEDGKFHASTGNGAIDWLCGTGKYTDGRF